MSWADKVQEQSEEGQSPGQGKMGPQPRPDGPAACTSGMSLRPWSGDPGGAGACPPLRASVARVPHQRVWTPRAGHPPAPVLPTSPPPGNLPLNSHIQPRAHRALLPRVGRIACAGPSGPPKHFGFILWRRRGGGGGTIAGRPELAVAKGRLGKSSGSSVNAGAS